MFLFDIKRSEVQGPILQFQSTIFEKDDIKKMVKNVLRESSRRGYQTSKDVSSLLSAIPASPQALFRVLSETL